jgi:hypothetical protein
MPFDRTGEKLRRVQIPVSKCQKEEEEEEVDEVTWCGGGGGGGGA